MGHPSSQGLAQGGLLIPFSQQSVLKIYVTDAVSSLLSLGQYPLTL